jgi:putative transcriptional regulator
MSELVINSLSIHRSAKTITQEELARAVGVTRQTIIAIEKGNYTPSVLLALKIAQYFNTSVESIFKVQL